jgi:predicted MFS family arabinose efflux permease
VTWRAIFWINVPVAVIALVLTAIAKPAEQRNPAQLDYRGAVLIAGGMGLAVLGLQQSSAWGWSSVATWGCIAAGLALLVAFVVYERRQREPLIDVRIFDNRAFAIDNAVLFLLMIVFVPLFFFASMYSQIVLGYDASNAGLYLLLFFSGFAVASQIGGRILDSRGARPAVVVGCLLSAVGLALLARELPDPSLDAQWPFIVLAGAGLGLVLGPANTDAVNRAPRTSYGEATGITQTVRNFGSSLGLAVLGTVLILENKSNIESSLGSLGVSPERADQVAHAITHGGGGDAGSFGEHAGRRSQELFEAVQSDFALSSRVVFYAMAGVMLVAFLVALVAMPSGRVEENVEAAPPREPAPAA